MAASFQMSEYKIYANLAAAVVCKAADDYRSYVEAPHPNAKQVEHGVDAEKFLRSQDCDLYTNIDGNYICDKIKRDARNNKNKRRITYDYARKKSYQN